ncbi:MAG TPA: hypothetical protein DIC22_11085 [Chitinophagaceae bacterium]|jgi:hypothetical protein|nr:hypothetical protein [Chitinophagaceae bacterium]
MILNKFRPVSYSRKLKALSLQLLAFSLFSCNKTADINANKAYVGLTHVAYGFGPLNVTLGVDSLLSVPLSFGQTSGNPGNPYDTATAGIRDLALYENSVKLINGYAAFQQGVHYSLFAYDSLDHQSLSLIILPDNQGVSMSTDTITYFRYLNFSPGTSLGLLLTNAKGTITISASRFVGYAPQPANYLFNSIPIGNYGVYVFNDSANFTVSGPNIKPVDSLFLNSAVNYNIYLQGFYDSSSGTNQLKLKSFPLN